MLKLKCERLLLRRDKSTASQLTNIIFLISTIYYLGGREGCCAARGVSRSETSFSADLGEF